MAKFQNKQYKRLFDNDAVIPNRREGSGTSCNQKISMKLRFLALLEMTKRLMSPVPNNIAFLALLLLGLSFGACERLDIAARFDPLPTQTDYFLKLYGGRFPDQGNDVLIRPDNRGYVVMATHQAGENEDTQLLLLETDQLGNEINTALVEDALPLVGTSLYTTGGDDFVLGGYTLNPDGTQDAVVGSYAWDLTQNWKQTLSVETDETLNRLILTSDNHIIAVGSTSSVDSFKNTSGGSPLASDLSDVWIAKLRADNGMLVWEKRYGFNGVDEGVAVREQDGEYYVLATTDNAGNDQDLLFIRLNTEGNILDQISLGSSGQDDIAADFQSFKGEWLVLSTLLATDGQQLQLHTISSDLSVEAPQSLASAAVGSFPMAQSLLVTDSDELIFSAGLRNTLLGSSQLLLGKTDRNGNVIWAKAYGGEGGNDLIGGMALDGASILLSGTLDYENDNTMICLVKTQEANGVVLP